jgi:hypothetical protein
MRTLQDGSIACRQSDRSTPDPWLIPAWAGDRRLVRRVACGSVGGFRQSQRMRVDVEIANLSTRGCAVTSRESQRVGTRCWIILPTLEGWEARVAWSRGTHHGLDFSRPLHRAVAEMIVERAEGRLPGSASDRSPAFRQSQP